MYRKFSELGFMIGLFFAIISVILAINALWKGAGTALNIYTAVLFFVFGVGMMQMKSRKDDERQP